MTSEEYTINDVLEAIVEVMSTRWPLDPPISDNEELSDAIARAPADHPVHMLASISTRCKSCRRLSLVISPDWAMETSGGESHIVCLGYHAIDSCEIIGFDEAVAACTPGKAAN